MPSEKLSDVPCLEELKLEDVRAEQISRVLKEDDR